MDIVASEEEVLRFNPRLRSLWQVGGTSTAALDLGWCNSVACYSTKIVRLAEAYLSKVKYVNQLLDLKLTGSEPNYFIHS